MNLMYKLFDEVQFVRGFSRGVIYDLHRKNINLISNDLIDILLKNDGTDFEKLKKIILNYSNSKICQEYIDFLLKNEYMILLEKKFINLFSPINIEFNTPATVFSACIDISNKTNFNLIKLMKELDDLGCKHLVFRFVSFYDLDHFQQTIETFEKLGFYSVEIWINMQNNKIQNQKFFHILLKNPKITSLKLWEYPYPIKKTNRFKIESFNNSWNDNFSKLTPFKNFQVNITHFMESHFYNSFYNKKIFINEMGEISNTIKGKNFGNINSNKIINLLSEEFCEIWNSKKDNTYICCDCEFRYMCNDKRIPKKEQNNKWSNEISCVYNPYICKSDGQEGYVPVEECGTYSIETGFVPNVEKINELNKLIWGEDE